ncbi:hypothetical protein L1987_16936 [Smallanthus sonchifolius]|uniref:Uncharacterized protein n=1 Tax=Smallanthus sonchifolius TaxID=185202 RepID=A0ACB9IVF5_9ASTR|nr:hypothetical protein L1987_16936 [Smallanthus sonchifolius]
MRLGMYWLEWREIIKYKTMELQQQDSCCSILGEPMISNRCGFFLLPGRIRFVESHDIPFACNPRGHSSSLEEEVSTDRSAPRVIGGPVDYDYGAVWFGPLDLEWTIIVGPGPAGYGLGNIGARDGNRSGASMGLIVALRFSGPFGYRLNFGDEKIEKT